MSMTPNKKAKWITGVILGAIVLIAAVVSVCLAVISNSSTPKIAILSCPEKVYYIDSDHQDKNSFIIKSAYVYNDGDIEDATGTISYNFVNDSDSDLLSIDSTGKIEVKFDAFSAVSSSYQVDKDDIIKVEIIVSSTLNGVDDIRHTINVVRKNDYNITLDLNGGNLADINPEIPVPAWEGQAVNLSNPTLENYTFDGWYVIQNGKDKTYNFDAVKFFSDDIYYWNDDITLRARYKTNVKLEMGGIDTEVSTKEIKDVYFNEELSPLQIQILNQYVDVPESNGWHLRGWFTELGGCGDENGVKNGVFCATEPTLYAKWSGVATLNLTQIIHNDDNEGIVSREGNVGVLSASALVNVPVVYHGAINLAPSQIPTYPEGGTFGGWYTDLYGAGEQITNEHGVGIYNSKSLQLYDKIVFTVNIDYNSATGDYDSGNNSFNITYGEVVDLVSHGLGRKPTKKGWKFGGWEVEYDNNRFEIPKNKPYTLLDDVTITAVWTWTFTLDAYIEEYELSQKEFEIKFQDETTSLPSLENWGSWQFDGWYSGEAGNGEQITTGNYDAVTSVSSSDISTLHAKWIVKTVTLNDNNGETPDYYLENLVYGKTIAKQGGFPKLESRPGYTEDETSGWYTDNDIYSIRIYDNMTTYPKSMSTLFFKWKPESYTVYLNHNGGESPISQITVTMGEPLPSIPIPTNAGKTFSGYFTQPNGGIQCYQSNGQGNGVWQIPNADDMTLHAQWDKQAYTVYFDGNGGDCNLDSISAFYLEPMIKPNGDIPTWTGFAFAGFYDNREGIGDPYYDKTLKPLKSWDKTSDWTLYAKWEANELELTVKKGDSVLNKDVTYSVGGDYITLSIVVSNGTGDYTYSTTQSNDHLDIEAPATENPKIKKRVDSKKGTVTVTVIDNISKEQEDFTFNYQTSGCFAAGTLITMGDGTQKKIEDIKVGDIVMSWNFVTGQLEPMPVALYWYHGTSVYTVLNLEFSNGKILRIIAEHGLFDCDLNKYIFISEDNCAEFIGHSFVIYDGADGYNKTLLVNAYLTTEEVGCYSLRTACNDNAFAEGLLSLTVEDYPGYLTYFEVGENMKYDEEKMQADIELYGLFTYDDWLNDWSKYISYEEFIAFNGQYFKILLGKGILTYEDILTLIDGLRNGPDIQS